ncbi:hypothetical protein BDV25DRAFT_159826 [Aspergillus avenaceus]|uniref:Aminoglycoside phosphotransferase domain-containing protein n=1 Tax=Aspergillus avenaceus TaxID=36643 RepID=A0A5N6TMX6_ASPAV|nr:hypothetical protein BDV25DRAFT_159826 [Aspergillus avenaceus]
MHDTLPFPISRLEECIAIALQSSPDSISLIRQPTIEGDDHMIFLIDSQPEYINRVTKPREDGSRSYNGQEMQTRDISLRRFIRDQYRARCLDEHVIPRSIGTWTLSNDGNYLASLETKLQGSDLQHAPVSELTVQGLEDFLSVLKGVDVGGLEERLGMKIPSVKYPDLKAHRESAIKAWARLVERGQITAKDIESEGPIDGFLERKTTMLEKIQHLSSEYQPILVHNDIKGEHFLVNSQSGRITGILDWADIGIGNAALDIAGLVLTVGVKPTRHIATKVGYGEDQVLQGVLQARCECVMRLDDRLNGNDTMSPVILLRDQLFLSLKD